MKEHKDKILLPKPVFCGIEQLFSYFKQWWGKVYLSFHPKFKTQFMLRLISIAVFACLIFSCNNEKGNNREQTASTQTPAQATATLPSIPIDVLQEIFQKGTQVDYIYHYQPFTASLSEKAAIQNSVRHVAEAPAPLDPNCKPAGIITYQIDGDIVLRADFYFETNCTYFVFYDKEDNKYSNYMTQEGINFFNTQILQAQQLRQQQMQQ